MIILIILLITIGIFFYVKNTNLPLENSENGEQNQKIQLDCQEIMQDVVEKISEISPVEPVLGGDWYISRFWFIKDDNENFYVEYEDGHILRRILLSVEKKPATSPEDKQAGREYKLNYKVIGYFEPGETTWVRKKGEDPFFDRELDLYEYDNESGQWLKKN